MRPAFAILVLAPAGAVVVIATLLLIGVNPHLVFLAGHGVKSGLEALGFHVYYRVGVLTTVLFWWGIIVAVSLAVRRWSRRKAA